MAKFQFLLALVFVAIMAISAQPVEESVSIPVKFENYGWSCGSGGDFGCSISCGLHGKFGGGHCNKNEVCICN
ncbi:hypothetical protein KPH14_009559 [Odynerus spinipes]|uniref:Defensin n=1 Tax=Odynerus spinipes TaxID=1348599 RepID=A0AAD9VQQ8_9HYME|nr:hypothetical protein KPH14_009559 [Odynerus spinipes]